MKLGGLPALTVIYVALNATGLFLLRDTLSDTANRALLDVLQRPRAISGLVLYAASFLTFIWALRSHPLTTVFPLFAGCGYAAVVIGGWTLLGEEFSAVHAAGVTLIGLGVVLVQLR